MFEGSLETSKTACDLLRKMIYVRTAWILLMCNFAWVLKDNF